MLPPTCNIRLTLTCSFKILALKCPPLPLFIYLFIYLYIHFCSALMFFKHQCCLKIIDKRNTVVIELSMRKHF